MIDSTNKATTDIWNVTQSLFSLIERYENGDLIFPATNLKKSARERNVREILKASDLGIPFPAVTFIELQTGQILAAESTERLKSIVEFATNKFDIENDRNTVVAGIMDRYSFNDLTPVKRRQIKYTDVYSRIIRYGTPPYMQLYIARYTETLSQSYMQALRRVVYSDKGIEAVLKPLREDGLTAYYANKEYDFMVFLTYITSFVVGDFKQFGADQLLLQENMLTWITMHESSVQNLYLLYKDLIGEMGRYHEYVLRFKKLFPHFTPFGGNVLGIAVAACGNLSSVSGIIDKLLTLFKIVSADSNKHSDLQHLLSTCDFSYDSLKGVIDYIT